MQQGRDTSEQLAHKGLCLSWPRHGQRQLLSVQVTFTGAQDTSTAQPEPAPPKSQRHPGPWQSSAQEEQLPQGSTKEDGVPGSMSLGHSNRHHRQCSRHSTLHAYAWRPSRTRTQMTTVKNSVYFSIKAELSFKNQVVSLVRGYGADAGARPSSRSAPGQELLLPVGVHCLHQAGSEHMGWSCVAWE